MTPFLSYVIGGAAVSWPVFIAGQVISHRRLRRKVEALTAAQTDDIKRITAVQTAELLPGRQLRRPPDV